MPHDAYMRYQLENMLHGAHMCYQQDNIADLDYVESYTRRRLNGDSKLRRCRGRHTISSSIDGYILETSDTGNTRHQPDVV